MRAPFNECVNHGELLTTAFTDIMDEKTKSSFRYWRLRIMYSMMIGYASFYLVRQNFAMAIPSLQETYGYTKTELGLVLSLFLVVYGVGKFVNGFLSDRSNARYFMSFGLLGSALMCILMSTASELWMFALLWGASGWFQSMGWPPCARLLTHWNTPKELGTKWGIWNSSHGIGGAIVTIAAGYLIAHYSWKAAFAVPGVVAVGISFFLFNRLRDTPQTVGLPPVEAYKGLPQYKEAAGEENLTFKEIFFEKLMYNRLLWYVCLANFFLYIVRMGLFNWAPTFLHEVKGSTIIMAGWNVAAFDIAGIVGGIFAGWLSDRVFHGRRGPAAFFYMVALVLVLFYFWLVPAGHVFLDTLAMMSVGFLVFGPQVLVGVAAADFASRKAVGAATGLTGTFGYFGASVGSLGLGVTVDRFGWDGGFIFFITAACLGAFFFALTWKQHSVQLAKLQAAS